MMARGQSEPCRVPCRGGLPGLWSVRMALGVLALINVGCAARATVQDPLLAERIDRYMTVRREAVETVGRVEITKDPRELREDVAGLAEQIQARRQDAREGDILGGPVADSIRASLRQRLARDDGERIVRRILEIQPEPFAPVINMRYPSGEPRASVPAPVLRVLPRLPQELSYRFVRQDLLLMDRNTGVILDVLHDALPTPLLAADP